MKALFLCRLWLGSVAESHNARSSVYQCARGGWCKYVRWVRWWRRPRRWHYEVKQAFFTAHDGLRFWVTVGRGRSSLAAALSLGNRQPSRMARMLRDRTRAEVQSVGCALLLPEEWAGLFSAPPALAVTVALWLWLVLGPPVDSLLPLRKAPGAPRRRQGDCLSSCADVGPRRTPSGRTPSAAHLLIAHRHTAKMLKMFKAKKLICF